MEIILFVVYSEPISTSGKLQHIPDHVGNRTYDSLPSEHLANALPSEHLAYISKVVGSILTVAYFLA